MKARYLILVVMALAGCSNSTPPEAPAEVGIVLNETHGGIMEGLPPQVMSAIAKGMIPDCSAGEETDLELLVTLKKDCVPPGSNDRFIRASHATINADSISCTKGRFLCSGTVVHNISWPQEHIEWFDILAASTWPDFRHPAMISDETFKALVRVAGAVARPGEKPVVGDTLRALILDADKKREKNEL